MCGSPLVAGPCVTTPRAPILKCRFLAPRALSFIACVRASLLATQRLHCPFVIAAHDDSSLLPAPSSPFPSFPQFLALAPQIGGPPWCKTLRLIHLAFSANDGVDRMNRIYALASDLLEDEAVNALVDTPFGPIFRRVLHVVRRS